MALVIRPNDDNMLGRRERLSVTYWFASVGLDSRVAQTRVSRSA